jgi:hypothetical protein
LLGEGQQLQARIGGDVLLGHTDQSAQPRRVEEGSGLLELEEQRGDEGLLAAFPVQVTEVQLGVHRIAALAHESHRLSCVDLLIATVEVGAGIVVAGVLLQTHSDRLHYLGELVEGDHGHFHEVVDRHAAQELGDRIDLLLATGVAASLLHDGLVAHTGSHQPLMFLVKRLLDLPLRNTVRAAREADVVVARDGDGGGPRTIARKVHQHQYISVITADLLVTGVQCLVNLCW